MGSISIKKTGITKLKVDAIVNAANEGLWEGGGVCGAIFREAGSAELTRACQAIGGCRTGSAVITPGFNLPSRYVIHAVGPVWQGGTDNEPELLYSAYRQALTVARDNGCHGIAFPLISAGIFGYPKDKAWEQALKACKDFIADNPDYEIDITFAVLEDSILKLGQTIMKEQNKKDVDFHTQDSYEYYKNCIRPGKYRHYKGGEYEVLDVAHHSETEETMVVYRALYGAMELWVRPAAMWDEMVEVNGEKVNRFTFIGD